MFCLGFHVYNFQILNVKISLKSSWCDVVTSGVGAEFVSHWVLNGGCSSYSLPQIWNVRISKWLFCMHVCCNVYNFFSSVFYVCHYWHGMYRKFMNCIFFTTSYIISCRGRFFDLHSSPKKRSNFESWEIKQFAWLNFPIYDVEIWSESITKWL